jgi:hypothetical protein
MMMMMMFVQSTSTFYTSVCRLTALLTVEVEQQVAKDRQFARRIAMSEERKQGMEEEEEAGGSHGHQRGPANESRAWGIATKVCGCEISYFADPTSVPAAAALAV